MLFRRFSSFHTLAVAENSFCKLLATLLSMKVLRKSSLAQIIQQTSHPTSHLNIYPNTAHFSVSAQLNY